VKLVSRFSLDSPSAFILFNTIPPCPPQTTLTEGRGMDGKFIPRGVTGEFLWLDPFLSSTSAKDIHWNLSFVQAPTDS